MEKKDWYLKKMSQYDYDIYPESSQNCFCLTSSEHADANLKRLKRLLLRDPPGLKWKGHTAKTFLRNRLTNKEEIEDLSMKKKKKYLQEFGGKMNMTECIFPQFLPTGEYFEISSQAFVMAAVTMIAAINSYVSAETAASFSFTANKNWSFFQLMGHQKDIILQEIIFP